MPVDPPADPLAEEFLRALQRAASGTGSEVPYASLYLFRDGYAARLALPEAIGPSLSKVYPDSQPSMYDEIRYYARQKTQAASCIVDALRFNLGAMKLVDLAYLPAETPDRYDLILHVDSFSYDGEPLPEIPLQPISYLEQRFACLVATLREIPEVESFRILYEGEPLPDAYAAFCMRESYVLDREPFVWPKRGPSQLTATEAGQQVQLQIYAFGDENFEYQFSDYAIDIEVHSAGESLEYLTLQAAFDAENPITPNFISLYDLRIHDGIAYVDCDVDPYLINSLGSTGSAYFYETIYANLRQFSQISHVLVMLNGDESLGLHGMIPSLRRLNP